MPWRAFVVFNTIDFLEETNENSVSQCPDGHLLFLTQNEPGRYHPFDSKSQCPDGHLLFLTQFYSILKEKKPWLRLNALTGICCF